MWQSCVGLSNNMTLDFIKDDHWLILKTVHSKGPGKIFTRKEILQMFPRKEASRLKNASEYLLTKKQFFDNLGKQPCGKHNRYRLTRKLFEYLDRGLGFLYSECGRAIY